MAVTAEQLRRELSEDIEAARAYVIPSASLEILRSDDRRASGKEALRLRGEVRPPASISEHFEEYAKAHEVGLFIPRGYSLAQAFANRYSQISNEEMIICDYDGCGGIGSLTDLIRGVKRTMMKVLLCRPPIVFAGAGLVRRTPAEKLIAPFQRDHMVPAYMIDRFQDCDWSQAIIDGREYARDHDMSLPHMTDIYNGLFFRSEMDKAMLQYIDFCEGDANDDPEAELYEVRCNRGFLEWNSEDDSDPNSPLKGKPFSDAQYEELNKVALICALEVIAKCDEALSRTYDDAEAVKAKIDGIRDSMAPIFHRTRDMEGGAPAA